MCDALVFLDLGLGGGLVKPDSVCNRPCLVRSHVLVSQGKVYAGREQRQAGGGHWNSPLWWAFPATVDAQLVPHGCSSCSHVYCSKAHQVQALGTTQSRNSRLIHCTFKTMVCWQQAGKADILRWSLTTANPAMANITPVVNNSGGPICWAASVLTTRHSERANCSEQA